MPCAALGRCCRRAERIRRLWGDERIRRLVATAKGRDRNRGNEQDPADGLKEGAPARGHRPRQSQPQLIQLIASGLQRHPQASPREAADCDEPVATEQASQKPLTETKTSQLGRPVPRRDPRYLNEVALALYPFLDIEGDFRELAQPHSLVTVSLLHVAACSTSVCSLAPSLVP